MPCGKVQMEVRYRLRITELVAELKKKTIKNATLVYWKRFKWKYWTKNVQNLREYLDCSVFNATWEEDKYTD